MSAVLDSPFDGLEMRDAARRAAEQAAVFAATVRAAKQESLHDRALFAEVDPAVIRDARGLTRPLDLATLGTLLGRLVLARLEPLPERQVLAAIKSATGITVSILEKQIGELRRRLNGTGDPNVRIVKPA